MVQTGDQLPDITLAAVINDEISELNLADYCSGKKVVLFAVPGAFTPGCSNTHLPGFVQNSEQLKAKGIDQIICTSVNDAFVMQAWGREQNVADMILLADGNADFAKAIGLQLDASKWRMGQRSQRYAMIIDDGVISFLGLDETGIDKSSAENILAQL